MISRALALISPLVIAPAAAENAPAPQPYQLVRALQVMQEEAAHGGGPATVETGQFVRQIAQEFARAPGETWADRRNARAAAIYLFSGGSPSSFRAVLVGDKLAESERPLVRGALAYAEGREGPARELLLALDPRKAAPNVGGHLALAQATLIGRGDPERYFQTLGLARLLMPGTVVEEAALRREIDAAADLNRIEKAAFLTEQYLRRYPSSVYGPPFKDRLARILAKRILEGDEAASRRAADLLDLLPRERRINMHLTIAREALQLGKLPAVTLSAERVLRQAPEGSAAAARAGLYLSAAQIVGPEHQAAVARARATSVDQLDRADRALRLAVLRMAPRLRTWPPAGASAQRPPAPATRADATIERARVALDELAAAMKDTAR